MHSYMCYYLPMKKQTVSYRIIVEKEQQKQGTVYVAYAPSLGLSDFGKSVDEAINHLTNGIKLYIETLVDLKKPIPAEDSEEYFVTTKKVELSSRSYPLISVS